MNVTRLPVDDAKRRRIPDQLDRTTTLARDNATAMRSLRNRLTRLERHRGSKTVRLELPYLVKLVCWVVLLEIWGILDLVEQMTRQVVRGWL